jgi:hypothetical protein
MTYVRAHAIHSDFKRVCCLFLTATVFLSYVSLLLQVDALAALFTAVGARLEASPREGAAAATNGYFAKLGRLVDPTAAAAAGLPTRSRFVLADLLELRKRKWKPQAGH